MDKNSYYPLTKAVGLLLTNTSAKRLLKMVKYKLINVSGQYIYWFIINVCYLKPVSVCASLEQP